GRGAPLPPTGAWWRVPRLHPGRGRAYCGAAERGAPSDRDRRGPRSGGDRGRNAAAAPLRRSVAGGPRELRGGGGAGGGGGEGARGCSARPGDIVAPGGRGRAGLHLPGGCAAGHEDGGGSGWGERRGPPEPVERGGAGVSILPIR